MGIGGALAEARSAAGLTIADVSERTRIRATIIRAIEQDDYAACGGDFYARGHIRAIARVVGTDPAPLIEEYDISHAPPPAPSEPGRDRGTSGWLRPVRSPGAGEPGGAGRHSGKGYPRPGGITAAEAFRPAMPLQLERRRRLSGPALVVVLIVLLAFGVLAYLLVSGGSTPARSPAHRASSAAHHPVAARRIPALTRTSQPPVPLQVASVEAVGPAGPSQGDSPQLAPLAIEGNPATPWHSDWYATPDFNGNQSGTGLLLDMGHSVTVASVRIQLGSAPGGTVELRLGDTPSLADLPVAATAANPGGDLIFRVSSPVAARYVLIWFTELPPDGTGTYQAYVSDVSVSGTA